MGRRIPMVGLLALQVLAVILYPPAFLQRAPQAAVLPPALVILFVLALLALHTGNLAPLATRTSLAFVQGINICVRLVMVLPNLRTPGGGWDWALLLCHIIGMGISWYTIIEIEKRPLSELTLKRTPA